ncbi:hypothetical protein [Bartonella machadoae]|uniref:hypothetical protein n=1 Tax=Bartonella machadoae TaxID=2893471 RepID=UPI001F4C8C6F|nr:hypothetical protein [Bartonella machadoae]UNE53596.1 hypothetical protein LNM86_08045 [Bartonella machadoae]
MHEGCNPIKERNKQQHEAMRNLHHRKDIALNAFESHKTERKNDGKDGSCFLPLNFYVLPK